MKGTFRAAILSAAFATLGLAMACSGGSQSTVAPSPSTGPGPSQGTSAIANDGALFRLLTQTDPFGTYSLFPNADAIANGSPFHGPMNRVRLNAKALAALQDGKLAPATRFPDSSVIVNEILTSAGTTTYSVLYKDTGNPLAANGWLWAEFSPSGTVGYSINDHGAACTSCHSSGQGATNDFVRTFERQRPVNPSTPSIAITSDSELFRLVTQTDPFGSYAPFPDVDEIFRGSTAHQPLNRVRMNAKALATLQNGKLPPQTRFPDGSVIFKEILTNGGTATTYSVLYKDAGNPRAANGWLWAEFSPTGNVGYSIENRGAGCTSCHSSGQGSTSDLVRTFERQHQ